MTAAQGVEERLLTAIRQGHAPHACLVCCADAELAERFCRRAAALFCTGTADAQALARCVDYFELGEGGIPVDAIRGVTAELAKGAFGGGGRVIYLRDAHAMNESAQNALLKTLEEPPGQTMFLLSGNENGLLPTIRSRCSRVLLPQLDTAALAGLLAAEGAPPAEAARCAALGQTIRRARRLWQDADYRALCESAQGLLAELLSGGLPMDGVEGLAAEAADAVLFMLAALRDMLWLKRRGAPAGPTGSEARFGPLAARLRTGQINAMIVILTDGLARLETNASARSTLTSLFTQLAEEINPNDEDRNRR